MKTMILAVITALALPLMAFGQKAEQEQQGTAQAPEQTNTETQSATTNVPTTGTTTRAKAKEETTETKAGTAKPETNTTNVREHTNVNANVREGNRSETRTHGRTNESTSTTRTVNKEEFRSRHSEVFSLGRHPKEFFVHRFGANHFRLIGNTYFVYEDGCWVAVDVDGFTYTERVICQGDPEFIVVE
jgi:hypothetical protein